MPRNGPKATLEASRQKSETVLEELTPFWRHLGDFGRHLGFAWAPKGWDWEGGGGLTPGTPPGPPPGRRVPADFPEGQRRYCHGSRGTSGRRNSYRDKDDISHFFGGG